MHNGVRVSALGYYGAGILNLLMENQGVHEPQEERLFAETLRLLPRGSSMIEAGAYWGFYSLWFAETVQAASCFLIEPSHTNILSGKANFREAGRAAVFEQAFIGAADGIAADGSPVTTIDSFCNRHGLERVAVLHSDIDGSEVDLLRGAHGMLAAAAIDYLFISTHSNDLHYQSIDILEGSGYNVLASADLDETYSVDGLIVAAAQGVGTAGNWQISRKSAKTSP